MLYFDHSFIFFPATERYHIYILPFFTWSRHRGNLVAVDLTDKIFLHGVLQVIGLEEILKFKQQFSRTWAKRRRQTLWRQRDSTGVGQYHLSRVKWHETQKYEIYGHGRGSLLDTASNWILSIFIRKPICVIWSESALNRLGCCKWGYPATKHLKTTP